MDWPLQGRRRACAPSARSGASVARVTLFRVHEIVPQHHSSHFLRHRSDGRARTGAAMTDATSAANKFADSNLESIAHRMSKWTPKFNRQIYPWTTASLICLRQAIPASWVSHSLKLAVKRNGYIVTQNSSSWHTIRTRIRALYMQIGRPRPASDTRGMSSPLYHRVSRRKHLTAPNDKRSSIRLRARDLPADIEACVSPNRAAAFGSRMGLFGSSSVRTAFYMVRRPRSGIGETLEIPLPPSRRETGFHPRIKSAGMRCRIVR
jgi:hypothetical protein